MLQFFDDLPNDRWAAFLYVERHARKSFLHGPPSVEARIRYVQMVLVAAYELKLIILPNWQSEAGLIYRAIGIGINTNEEGEGVFSEFERDLTAVMPKIELLASRNTALRHGAQVRLELARELKATR